MHPLLLQLDLDHPGLEEANALARASCIHEALAAVVRYFRARPEPDPSLLAAPNAGAVEASERAIAREFVFYQVPGKVPPGNWDWTWRPGTDWEWTYALNRHHWWAELAAAYLATGDQRYAQELDSLIRSWVGQCPVRVDDTSAWRTLETGIRVSGPWIGILSAMEATRVIT
ncbi:MAG TPA: heparinase II/III family protein, partial [Candidatus Latescibacteria bacterium]|nr:heparinase II/III family protein [Candidatus Latescibacterota bacterium]